MLRMSSSSATTPHHSAPYLTPTDGSQQTNKQTNEKEIENKVGPCHTIDSSQWAQKGLDVSQKQGK